MKAIPQPTRIEAQIAVTPRKPYRSVILAALSIKNKVKTHHAQGAMCFFLHSVVVIGLLSWGSGIQGCQCYEQQLGCTQGRSVPDEVYLTVKVFTPKFEAVTDQLRRAIARCNEQRSVRYLAA